MTPAEFLATDPDALRLLESDIPARFAYTALDRTPRVVPVGFNHAGGRIVIGTAEHAPKADALRADPAVAVTIDTNAFPPLVLQVRGTAAVTVVDGVDPDYLAGSRRLVAPDQWDDFERQVRAMYPRMARIELTPTWAQVYDFTTRLPKTLADLAG